MGTPERILHYETLTRIGVGGMGVVYRAFDTRLQRPVALKFLSESAIADKSARSRLLVEAQAAAALDHPHIATVYAIEEADDGIFIAMRYYEGETLEARLFRGRLEPTEALEFVRQAASGLQHAHEQGIIHRDVKPANLFLTASGLKVLDFGIAHVRERSGLTQIGEVMGTMEYMSPEQVRGQNMSPATDVWSLGVILYEAISGISPFRDAKNPLGSVLNVVTKEPAPLPELPGITPELTAFVRRTLAKRRDERYPDMRSFLHDLKSLQNGVRLEFPAPTPPPATLPIPSGATPHTLPPLRKGLIERGDELALVSAHLKNPDCRLLTLLGTGGTGKTILSLQAAYRQTTLGDFEGIYFVPLETASSRDLALAAVALALGLDSGSGKGDALARIAQATGERRLLLVLDNFEQLSHEALLVSDLLESCPHLKLLVSSRERLNVEEEWVMLVPGLAYPTEKVSLEEAARFPAVELFVRRAERLGTFTLEEAQLPSLLLLLQRLRGLPLAIELAAVWVRLMPVAAIAEELERDRDFLSASARNTVKRHSSIRSVFESSWDLLGEAEQRGLAQLAVFRGGFRAEAAAEVTGAPLGLLASLMDKSLLSSRDSRGRERFEQHPLLGSFSLEKLETLPEAEGVRRRHSLYYLRLLHAHSRALRGPQQRETLREIEAEHANLLAAWEQALCDGEEVALAQAVEPLRIFYDQRGLMAQGVRLFEETLERLKQRQPPPDARSLGAVYANLAWLLVHLGQHPRAHESAERAVGLLEGLEGDAHSLIIAQNALGAIAGRSGNYLGARALFASSLTLAQAQGERGTTAMILDNLASIEQQLGNPEAARGHYLDSLQLSRQEGNHAQVALSLNNLGALLSSGQPQEAIPLLREGLTLARALDLPRFTPYLLVNLGQSSFLLGDYRAAQEAYLEALELVRQRQERWLEGALLADLGRVYAAEGAYVEASVQGFEALRIAWELQHLPVVLHALVCMAERLTLEQKTQEALELLEAICQHPAIRREDQELAQGMRERLESPLCPPARDLPGLVEALLAQGANQALRSGR